MLYGVPLMVQAPVLDGELLDLFSRFDDGGCTPEVSVDRCDVVEAFIGALVVAVLNCLTSAALVWFMLWIGGP